MRPGGPTKREGRGGNPEEPRQRHAAITDRLVIGGVKRVIGPGELNTRQMGWCWCDGDGQADGVPRLSAMRPQRSVER